MNSLQTHWPQTSSLSRRPRLAYHHQDLAVIQHLLLLVASSKGNLGHATERTAECVICKRLRPYVVLKRVALKDLITAYLDQRQLLVPCCLVGWAVL